MYLHFFSHQFLNPMKYSFWSKWNYLFQSYQGVKWRMHQIAKSDLSAPIFLNFYCIWPQWPPSPPELNTLLSPFSEFWWNYSLFSSYSLVTPSQSCLLFLPPQYLFHLNPSLYSYNHNLYSGCHHSLISWTIARTFSINLSTSNFSSLQSISTQMPKWSSLSAELTVSHWKKISYFWLFLFSFSLIIGLSSPL